MKESTNDSEENNIDDTINAREKYPMDSIGNSLNAVVVTSAHEETVEQQCVNSASLSVPNGPRYTQVPIRCKHQNIRRHSTSCGV